MRGLKQNLKNLRPKVRAWEILGRFIQFVWYPRRYKACGIYRFPKDRAHRCLFRGIMLGPIEVRVWRKGV